MSASATLLPVSNNNNNNYSYASNIIHMYKYQKPIMDDTTLEIALTAPQLIKSNSYSGTSTRFPLEANSNCELESAATECSSAKQPTSSNNMGAIANAIEESSECDAFLINPSSSRRNSNLHRLPSQQRRNTCSLMRTQAFLMRNCYLNYLVPICLIGLLLVVGYLTRNYAKELLFWIETQNAWLTFVIFMALFTVVSFPIVVGYLVLLITAGYLFGCWRGWLTVILGANVGIAIAHATIRSCRHRIAVHKLIKNETGRAILRVISGPKAFRVVLFTRLTPIPFGLQNAIFGISTIKARDYHLATFLGLLPAQTINVYLGSTLRSMHEVLNDHDTKLTGYISFVVEVICGAALMFWVVQKARKELSETLLESDYSNDGKPIDIQV
ncbi:transmembrane protein 64 [Drosophila grimshawi]|uniref:GH16763 n=1 Tax=Drosophila grimshawi TaxID=7222 RepID=B4J3Q2_DROGR|nr:transmembrane protein 64 [Drosophila grimshawi]EDV97283.1 GH16763 [Drosophila grimshawi]